MFLHQVQLKTFKKFINFKRGKKKNNISLNQLNVLLRALLRYFVKVFNGFSHCHLRKMGKRHSVFRHRCWKHLKWKDNHYVIRWLWYWFVLCIFVLQSNINCDYPILLLFHMLALNGQINTEYQMAVIQNTCMLLQLITFYTFYFPNKVCYRL